MTDKYPPVIEDALKALDSEARSLLVTALEDRTVSAERIELAFGTLGKPVSASTVKKHRRQASLIRGL